MKNLPGDPKEVMQKNLAFLRSYAQQTIEEGNTDLVHIDGVKETIMDEFLSLGKSFGLKDRDLAVMLYRGVLTSQKNTH